MSTRGIYGYRKDGIDYLKFSRFDAMPTRLGMKVLTGKGYEEFNWAPIDGTWERDEEVEKYALISGSVDVEYGYIMNYDKKVFEYYTASAHDDTKEELGRYAGKRELKADWFSDPDKEYTCYGMQLINEIPFETILNTPEIDKQCFFNANAKDFNAKPAVSKHSKRVFTSPDQIQFAY